MESNTEEETAIEEFNAEVKLQQCLLVMQAKVRRSLNTEEACAEINLSPRTFYQWMKDGVLRDYLVECKDIRHQEASVMANEAVPDIMSYHIKIATGKEFARGTPPHVAAELVMKAASGKELAPSEGFLPDGKAPVLQFCPQSMTMTIGEQGPRPATEEEILEAEEVTDVTE
jgi:hypothetical protein